MFQPNLLLVGFVKCGTTSLAKYLANHPGVLTPATKELYYLTDDGSPLRSMLAAINRMRAAEPCHSTPPWRYADYFPPNAGQRYAIDATPHYYSQAAALDYARDHRDVKIIFMVRDPVARLVSSYRFFRGMFQEYPEVSLAGFVDALLDVDEKRDVYRRRIRKEFFRYLFDVELDMGCYERHFATWLSAIDGGRVFIGTMEELRDSPKALMRRLCCFLDLDGTIYETFGFTPYMQSYAVRLPLLQRLGRRFGKEDLMRYDRIDRYQSPFHSIANDRIRKILDHVYQRLQTRHPDDIDICALRRLHDFYLPYNLRLRDRYGIDYVGAGIDAQQLWSVSGMPAK